MTSEESMIEALLSDPMAGWSYRGNWTDEDGTNTNSTVCCRASHDSGGVCAGIADNQTRKVFGRINGRWFSYPMPNISQFTGGDRGGTHRLTLQYEIGTGLWWAYLWINAGDGNRPEASRPIGPP